MREFFRHGPLPKVAALALACLTTAPAARADDQEAKDGLPSNFTRDTINGVRVWAPKPAPKAPAPASVEGPAPPTIVVIQQPIPQAIEVPVGMLVQPLHPSRPIRPPHREFPHRRFFRH